MIKSLPYWHLILFLLHMKKLIALIAVTAVAFGASTFASGEVTTGSTTGTNIQSTQTDAQKAAVLSCIKVAALTREGYLQSAYRSFSDAVMVAYLRRSEAIDAAYTSTKTMKDARPLIKTAFDTWKVKVKEAREKFKKTRKDIWNTFRNDIKACRPDRATSKDATMDSTGQERSE